MQNNAPEVMDLALESKDTRALYGIDDPATENFGRQCLLARRMCEAGVRFVQVTYGDNTANPAWDQHSNLPKHGDHARAVDKPIAGLLADLNRRGLLKDTLVWWGGEFGRTPYAEENGAGRDHKPGGVTPPAPRGGAPRRGGRPPVRPTPGRFAGGAGARGPPCGSARRGESTSPGRGRGRGRRRGSSRPRRRSGPPALRSRRVTCGGTTPPQTG